MTRVPHGCAGIADKVSSLARNSGWHINAPRRLGRASAGNGFDAKVLVQTVLWMARAGLA